MKNTASKTILVTLQLVIIGVGICALYAVYVPLAIVRVFVNREDFVDFLDCVGDFARHICCWFRKGVK